MARRTYGPSKPGFGSYGPFNYERTLGTRNYTATASVTDFVRKTEKRMSVLVKQATTDLINEVQTPVGKGGKMPLDTGFLRASGILSLTGIPSGPTVGKDGKKYPEKDFSIAMIKNWTLGTTIYFGWTANYAKYQEAQKGFLISGIQNWQQIVDRVCKRIQTKIEGTVK